jgi:AcrR family transcriptional regulator
MCCHQGVEATPLELVQSIDQSVVGFLPPDARVVGTRGRILTAGLELIAARGYHGTSIRDIAAKVGLTSGSLYTHFASKEAVLAELVLLGHEWHHRALVTALVSAGGDPADQLAELVRAHVTAHCRYPLLSRVITTERLQLEPEAYAPSGTLRSASWDLFAEVVRRGVEQGAFDIEEPDVTHVAISYLGISAADWFPEQDALSPEDVGNRYAKLALRMVGAAPRSAG